MKPGSILLPLVASFACVVFGSAQDPGIKDGPIAERMLADGFIQRMKNDSCGGYRFLRFNDSAVVWSPNDGKRIADSALFLQAEQIDRVEAAAKRYGQLTASQDESLFDGGISPGSAEFAGLPREERTRIAQRSSRKVVELMGSVEFKKQSNCFTS
ncbi:MAG: hypothetical protein HY078_02810 [Elusimicrobia bacterium]|nr:hypothetical protein [Elusimicrobiota bacterium]